MIDWNSGDTSGPSGRPFEERPMSWRAALPVAAASADEGRPPMATAPFDGDQARAYQEAWARHLGLEVEVTDSMGMKFRLIPPGEFTMGSLADEAGRRQWEGPRHRVQISRPFYLSTFLVTQEEYEEVQGANPSFFRDQRRPQGDVTWDTTIIVEVVRSWEGERRPVECVSWKDAVSWCRRLSASKGPTYRLPTEAEWEYACRAGCADRWSCGDALRLAEYAWFEESASRTTHPVGEKSPNAWGLYDMHGNVREWCLDWFDSRYAAQSPTIDPRGTPSGLARVLRGGAWNADAAACRSAARHYHAPTYRDFATGFRVAFVPPERPEPS